MTCALGAGRSPARPPSPSVFTPSRPRALRGFSLLELLVVITLLALVVTLAVPPLKRASAGVRLKLAAGEVATALRLAKSAAVKRSARVAVKFRTGADGRVSYSLYRDGDGDGVRNRDIDRGIDPPLRRAEVLRHLGSGIRFGFPSGKPPRKPSGRGRIGRRRDPIRFNRSDLASFDPMGTSTPGSVYLTDGGGRLAVVRLYHRSGKVQVLVYDPESERWR